MHHIMFIEKTLPLNKVPILRCFGLKRRGKQAPLSLYLSPSFLFLPSRLFKQKYVPIEFSP